MLDAQAQMQLADTPASTPANIWHVDYNATVAKDAAMGWQGMGFVLGFNAFMFLVALAIFQAGARSTRFSLFKFGTSSILSARAEKAANFTLAKWAELLWRTPIRGTDVETQLGPEGTFYLVYQLYTARFLAVLSVFAMLVLLPLYLTIGAHAMAQVEAAAEKAVQAIENIADGSAAAATAPGDVNLFTVAAQGAAPLAAKAVATASSLASASASSDDVQDDGKWWSFAHATIRVIPHESPYLWVPVVTCYLFTLAFLVFYLKLSQLSSVPRHAISSSTAGSTQLGVRSMSTMSAAPLATLPSSGSINGGEDGAGDANPAQASDAPVEAEPATKETASESAAPAEELSPDVEAAVASDNQEALDAGDAEAQPLLTKESEDKSEDKTSSDKTTTTTTTDSSSKRTHLIGMEPSALSSRSLFVDRGLPKTLREARMLRLLDEVFPGYVEDVSVVFNLAEFHALQARRREAVTELERTRCLHQKEMEGEKISWSLRLFPGGMMVPSLRLILRNLLCCFWCCCRPPPFEVQEEQLQAKIAHLREQESACLSYILHENKGAGRAFVIFRSARLRARFVRRVRNQSIMSILARFPEHAQPRLVRYVRELGLTRWHLESAPEPDDIDWQSVSFPFAKRTAVVLVVNVCILMLLLLFTSPVAVTSAISSSSSYSQGAAQGLSDLVAQIGELMKRVSPQMAKMLSSYVPTLILVMINAVLINVLQLAGRIQPVSTDSAKERMILRTAAVYLIFNTVFVPSLAFASIDAVLLYLEDDGEVLGMLGTLFLHNSGIFYVDYVLQRCFLGTAVVLLRCSEYCKFSWAKPRALTPREQVQAVEADMFYTGTQAALQISTLTIVLIFSTVVPLILPIGWLYFVMQHAVDKYSLLKVRRRIKGRGSIARTATHATCVSLLLYQGAMSGFILERGTTMQSGCVLVLLMATYLVALWGYVRDKERAHAMIERSGHDSRPRGSHDLRRRASVASTMASEMALQDKRAYARNNGRGNDSSVTAGASEQQEPEEPPTSTASTEDERSVTGPGAGRSQLDTLNEASALLVPSYSDMDNLMEPLDADSSELYREPALRRSMRMSFGPRDLGDYGTWRQV